MAIQVLHLEDDPLDAALVHEELRRDGLECDIAHVPTRIAFESALARKPDIVLADYALPDFNGLEAQRLLRERWSDVPFVLVSGSLGEERAIEALRHGATDYVLKHRLQPLPGVVRRALAESHERACRLRAEEELRTLNAGLEQRVRERTHALEAANAALAAREEELRRSEAFLSSIVEHLPDLLFVKDAQSLRYVRFNRTLEGVFGRRREDIVGRADSDLFPAAEAGALMSRDRAALQSSGVDVREESLHTPDQGWRTFHTKRVPIRDSRGTPMFLLGIGRDITEQRLAEHAVRHARVEADRANRAKSEFLARMSHELRTPLNAVLGFAQLFRLEALGQEEVENVQQILHGGEHLLDLITEVLDIARIEAGRLAVSLEPVDARKAAAEVIDLIRPLAAQRRIVVRGPSADLTADSPGPFVLGDRQRLKQILLNICSNAVKYNSEGGEVDVSCSRIGQDAIRISVRDTGPGISPEKAALLFTPFERLGAERSGIEGTGLGLALSKRLAEAMQGRISLLSGTGEGCTFTVELPSTSAPPIADTQPAGTVAAAGPATEGSVLYVEDTIANVRLMQRLMARRPGVELLHAPDGRTGLQIFKERRPGVVLLDLHLPDMTGEEVLGRLRTSDGASRPTVVVLSADASASQRTRMLAKGADAYLVKPLSVPAVLDVIDRALTIPDGSLTRLAG